MEKPIITVDHIYKSFKVGIQEVPILKDVSFTVDKGDFVIIFGPSGCGKSTLLHALLGLEAPTSGTVCIDNTNLYEEVASSPHSEFSLHSEDERSEFRKKHIGMVYQQPNWIKSLSVVENVAFPLYLLGEDKTTANIQAGQILRNMKMDKWMSYVPTELSSGQQQRIALARALITKPDMIIADEPTGNLDFDSGQELMKLLAETNRQGQTIVMVSHDLDYLDYAITAIRMFDGTIVDKYRGKEKKLLTQSVSGKRGGGALNQTEANFQHNQTDMTDFKTVMDSRPAKAKSITPKHRKFSPLSAVYAVIRMILDMASFFILLIVYLFNTHFILKIIRFLYRSRPDILQKYFTFCSKITRFMDKQAKDSISRADLIEMAIKNMISKRTRTFITIGGMTIGIGAIVFLVSIGYGLQQVVVTRVARLDEMKQAEISPQTGGKVKINDKTLTDLRNIPAVKMALPLIAVVGRINYKNSVSDMAVFGVTTDYLKQSAIQPVSGKIFESNELASRLPHDVGQVAGVASEASFGAKIRDADFTITPSTWIKVMDEPASIANVIGYTKRVEGVQSGEEVWGEGYTGKTSGRWMKTSFLLWKKEKCDSKIHGDCENDTYKVMRNDDNTQTQKSGFIEVTNLSITGVQIRQPRVLGITDDNKTNEESTTTSAAIDWVEIASEAGLLEQEEVKKVEIGSGAIRQAVVNRAMLKVLGIEEADAVGKAFDASFVVVGELLEDGNEKVESVPASYTIVGVTPEDKTPVFYVPFLDLRTLGIANFSQAKVVVSNQADLGKVRKQIEAMGYVTRSVVDTVAQINSLFTTARTVLMMVGMVALAVASLGMFNTLTVSLLERTREVGLMKAMGMKSSEVQELFLTESMILGFFGGLFGILLGWIAGKLAGVVLSLVAIFHGVGYIDISYIPFSFIFAIIVLSLSVGIVTGIYPARRAKKISALNALRYE